MKVDVLTSGYVSMDHIIKIATPAKVGDYESNGFKKFLEEGNVPQDGITQIAEEATSVCYLLQDNNNDHITIFYPGAMDGRYAQKMKEFSVL